MTYQVEIITACPGTEPILKRGFPTRKEAQWYAEREMDAAAELFTDARADLSVAIIRQV